MIIRILLVIASFGLATITLAQIEKSGFRPPKKESIKNEIQNVFIQPKKEVDVLTVSFVGDMVPANYLYNQNVFKNVQEELKKADLTIGNLEGTFAEETRLSKCLYMEANKCYAFRGDKNFADELKNAGFDVVSLKNNHAFDFGEEGLADTTKELDRVGIKYITNKKPFTSIEVKGKQIGILGLSSTKPWESISDYNFIEETVAKLSKENDYVIVVFHGGNEGSDKTIVPYATEYTGLENRGDVAKVARIAIDSGADLILGSGPHVLRKIDTYKDKVIAYSLGNFIGGDGKLITNGILGISGILTTTLSEEVPPQNYFIPIILNRSGVPFIDSENRGLDLILNLSKTV